MSATTGPVLAIGAITMANRSIFHDKPMDWRIPVATGAAAGFFSLIEQAAPEATRLLAWAALVTVLFTRLGGVESPAEAFLSWWGTAGAPPTTKQI